MARGGKSKVNVKGRNVSSDRFARLPHKMLRSEAYRSLSPSARALLVDLAMIENGSNNGSLYLSIRDAADRLGMSDLTSVTSAFDELVDRGFVRCSKEAHFAVKAAEESRARSWRLTWLVADRRPPSNEWDLYSAPAESKARKRADRGHKALKRYSRQLTSGRLPVLETNTKPGKVMSEGGVAVLETTTDLEKNIGFLPNFVVRDSSAHSAVTITSCRGEWWRQRSYLRLPDPYVLVAANDADSG